MKSDLNFICAKHLPPRLYVLAFAVPCWIIPCDSLFLRKDNVVRIIILRSDISFILSVIGSIDCNFRTKEKKAWLRMLLKNDTKTRMAREQSKSKLPGKKENPRALKAGRKWSFYSAKEPQCLLSSFWNLQLSRFPPAFQASPSSPLSSCLMPVTL